MNSKEAPERFRDFFQGIWGVSPYPWQEALLEEVLGKGWPEAVALPTGSGKTAVLDLAVFLIAWDPGRFHRRVYYVVNRRLVVDQAEARAHRIAKALEMPQSPGVRWVAERLRELAGKGPLLQVVKLRGGLPLPRHPVEDPARPAVILSTVDQAGSRLLFRGYSLSPRAWPVEAGLAGVDGLFLLDEAHLERPFWNLLQSLQELIEPAAKLLCRPTLRRVALTATPETLGTLKAFRHTDPDRRHPRLARVWEVAKPLALVKAKRGKLDATLAEEAFRLYRDLEGPVVVFCNRVDLARKVHKHLEGRLREHYRYVKEAEQPRALLLTGRLRPFDRDRLLGEDLQDRLDRGQVAFVVATQTLEVGADLDFTALVSELCSLTALLQRLGRLGRRGVRAPARGVVVFDPSAPPHPYAESELKAAWNWLSQLAKRKGEINAGILSLRRALDEDPPPPEAWGSPVEEAPLTRELLRLFALTDPWVENLVPEPFLHGLRPVSPEVGLVFRADLTEKDLDPKTLEERLPRLSDLIPPPNAYEVLTVPLWAARAFLEGRPEAAKVSDLEGEGEEAAQRSQVRPRKALRWTEEGPEVVNPEEIRPGDTLLLPATYGGLDEYGWNPSHTGRARDVAEARPPGARPPHLLRLHPEVLPDTLDEQAWKELDEEQQKALKGVPELFGKYFRALEQEDLPQLEKAKRELEDALLALEILPPERALSEDPEAALGGAEALGRAILRAFLSWLFERVDAAWRPALERALEDLSEAKVYAPEEYPGLVLRFRGESLSIGGARPVTLRRHQEEVWAVLKGFLDRLGLSEGPRHSLEDAARRHDEGKLDPRMQRWLRSTLPSNVEVDPDEPLAKSGTRMGPREVERWRKLAGYPKGQRHELQGAAAFRGRLDRLAIHLIATHHGYARPLPKGAPDVDLTFKLSDGTPANTHHGLDRLRSGWAWDFFCLQDMYTPWGLAYLEALLRLADQAASAEEPDVSP